MEKLKDLSPQEKTKFVKVCFYYFLGREEEVIKLLGNGIKMGDKYNVTPSSTLEQIINYYWEYRNLIHFYNARGNDLKGKEFFEAKKNELREDYNNYKNDLKWKMKRPVLEKVFRKKEEYLENIKNKLDDFITHYHIYDEKRYSRNAFLPYKKDSEILDYLTIIMVYLLRGYCTLWSRESSLEKDPNWAKIALNDLIQAYYLIQRMINNEYHKAKFNKKKIIKIGNESIEEKEKFDFSYCEPTFKSDITTKRNEKERRYILWWLDTLVDILQANVYRKINNNTASFDFYCQAIRKLENFKGLSGFYQKIPHEEQNRKIKSEYKYYINNYICKTLAKVRFEKAKIYFDHGQFMESLKWHILALKDIILIHYTEYPNGSSEAWKLLKQIGEFVKFLNHEKEMAVFQVNQIFPLKKHDLSAALKNIIKSSYKELCTDILARIDFLYSVILKDRISVDRLIDNKRKKKLEVFPIKKKDIEVYFTPPWKDGGYESSYWNYNRNENIDGRGFPNDYARMFAYRVKEAFSYKKRKIVFASKVARKLGTRIMFDIDNLVTIPRGLYSFIMREGYIKRAGELVKDKNIKNIKDSPANKFVVLRRWQSFTPAIPRPLAKYTEWVSNIPGGGYFLLWKGKGIVIDPGFNFIQNFYDEGFSLEDIDAVVVTHAHPDHESELSTILTLIHEWNEYWRKNHLHPVDDEEELNREKKNDGKKRIDLFLNTSTYRKYHVWIHAPKAVVGKIYPLSLNLWNKDTPLNLMEKIKKENNEDKISEIFDKRGGNLKIDLLKHYNLILEIIPAWHNELISHTSAVGLKFWLFKKNLNDTKNRPEIKLGITGDTYAYKNFIEGYKDCDILIAHLGDVKIRELITLYNFTEVDLHNFVKKLKNDILGETYEENKHEEAKKLLKKMRDIIQLFAELDIINWDKINKDDLKKIISKDDLKEIKVFLSDLERQLERNSKKENQFKELFNRYINKIEKKIEGLFDQIKVEYEYYNHMGIKGLCDVLEGIEGQKTKKQRLFIIGELPEELGSFRQEVAHCFNKLKKTKKFGCLTGDIGLHVGIKMRGKNDISIRCHQCNHNNELIKKRDHYHPLNKIQEFLVKRCNNAMVYLCDKHNPNVLHKSKRFKSEGFINYVYQRYV